MTIYFAPNQPQDGAFPAILAIGDSWFSHPKASNLLAEGSAAVKLRLAMVQASAHVVAWRVAAAR